MGYDIPPNHHSSGGSSVPAPASSPVAPPGVKQTDTGTQASGGGLRHNKGKNRLDLIPPEWTWGLGNLLTIGSWKYAARNWERGLSWGDTVGCAKRHVEKFLAGERYDPETGCHHMLMAAWNCLVLMTMDLRGIGDNDLPNVGMDVMEAVNNGKGTIQPPK